MNWDLALARLRELLGRSTAFSFTAAAASDYGVLETTKAPASTSVRPILESDVIAFGTGSGAISIPRSEVEVLDCEDDGASGVLVFGMRGGSSVSVYWDDAPE